MSVSFYSLRKKKNRGISMSWKKKNYIYILVKYKNIRARLGFSLM